MHLHLKRGANIGPFALNEVSRSIASRSVLSCNAMRTFKASPSIAVSKFFEATRHLSLATLPSGRELAPENVANFHPLLRSAHLGAGGRFKINLFVKCQKQKGAQ